MIDDKTVHAFKRIANISTEIVGDDCKDDLILLGTGLGFMEEDLRVKFPNLYERGIDNITIDDIKEEEEPLIDEEESKTTDED